MRDSAARRGLVPLLVPALALAAACADAPTEPYALVVAGEAEAALEIAAALPTLPRLIEAATGGPPEHRIPIPPAEQEALAQARALWLDAEDADDEAAARALRESARRTAAPVLAARLDEAVLDGAERALEEWLAAASPVVDGAAAGRLDATLAEARRHLDRARAARASGDRAAAVEAVLRAADRLVATTPRAVALRLARAGAAALAARRGAGPPGPRADPVALRRAERLLRGAGEAIEAGDYLRAIRRAYYALRLVE